MNVKWERTDLVVGLVIVLAAVVLAGTLLWITPALTQRTYPIYAEFDNVEGIAVRAPVQLYGYRVGHVDEIEPRVGSGGALVFRVRMAIDRRLESGETFDLPVGTEAVLTPPPLPIGAGLILLSFPEQAGPPLEPGTTIAGRRAPVALDHVQALTTNLDRQLLETTAVARRLMDTLIVTASTMNRSLTLTNEGIQPLFQGLQAELAAAEALTVDLRTQLNALGPAAVAGIDSATALVADSRLMVQRINGVIGNSEAQIEGILANLDTTTVLVESLTRQLSERPIRTFLFGSRPVPGYTAPVPDR